MVDILREEISKLEIKQLYVFYQSLRKFPLYYCYFAFSSLFLLIAVQLMSTYLPVTIDSYWVRIWQDWE